MSGETPNYERRMLNHANSDNALLSGEKSNESEEKGKGRQLNESNDSYMTAEEEERIHMPLARFTGSLPSLSIKNKKNLQGRLDLSTGSIMAGVDTDDDEDVSSYVGDSNSRIQSTVGRYDERNSNSDSDNEDNYENKWSGVKSSESPRSYFEAVKKKLDDFPIIDKDASEENLWEARVQYLINVKEKVKRIVVTNK